MKRKRGVHKAVRRAFPKRLKTCRKPIRRAANTGRKTDSLFDMMGLDTETLFGMTAKKAAAKLAQPTDAGWGATFASLNVKKIVANVIKKRNEHAKWRAAQDAKWAGQHKQFDRKWKAEKATEAKRKYVNVSGDRAEQIAMTVLKQTSKPVAWTKSTSKTIPGQLALAKGKTAEEKTESVKSLFRLLLEPTIKGGRNIFRTDKGPALLKGNTAEVVPWKSLVEVAERVVQSPRRPKWMTSVEQTEKLVKEWSREKRLEEKRHKAWQKKHDRWLKKRNRQEEKRLSKHHAWWDSMKPTWNANDEWLKRTSRDVAKLIKGSVKREPVYDEVAAVITEGLKKRGLVTERVTEHGVKFTEGEVHQTSSEGGPLNKVSFSHDVNRLIPGAVITPKEALKSGAEDEE